MESSSERTHTSTLLEERIRERAIPAIGGLESSETSGSIVNQAHISPHPLPRRTRGILPQEIKMLFLQFPGWRGPHPGWSRPSPPWTWSKTCPNAPGQSQDGSRRDRRGPCPCALDRDWAEPDTGRFSELNGGPLFSSTLYSWQHRRKRPAQLR